MNWKTITRNVGYALLVSALFMFASVIIAIFDKDDTSLGPLAVSFIITFMVGIFPFIFVRRSSAISLKEGYVIIVLSWLLSFIVGMLPYALWGGPFTLVNAWFESVSGYTTTGGTILEDVESLPKALLFWRSSTHFIGGLGVVVFLLLVIPESNPMRLRLTNMELSSLSQGAYRTRTNRTVSIFTGMYLGLNVLAAIVYFVLGMNAFDAICHAFSVVATGGFSTRNLSIASFSSAAIDIATIIIIYLSTLHFGMLFAALVQRSLKPLNKSVFKYYTLTVVFFTLVVAISLHSSLGLSWQKSLLNSSFEVMCYMSSAGFGITDTSKWPFFAAVVLLLIGFQGGMAGSTSGGVKADRLLLLFKNFRKRIYHALHPSAISEIKVNGKTMSEEEVYPHVVYIAMYFMVALLSVMLALMFSPDNKIAVAGVISSLNNVGASIGELGTFGNYAHQPDAVKLVYTLDMFLGRVELYPVLAVVSLIFGRRGSR